MSTVTYKKPRLGAKTWGLSYRWFCFCPWNGNESWIQLPLIFFQAGKDNVELGLGFSEWRLTIDIRWRW